MIEISPSILAADKDNFNAEIYSIEVAGADYVHIDVMDNIFVPNKTDMLQFAQTIKHISNVPLDVHLMVKDVKKYIDMFLPLEPNIITFHIEAIDNVDEIIDYLKQNNIKIGLSIKPNTPVEKLYKYLDKIHMVLIMTVEPGFGGQKLIPQTIEKVKELKEYIENNNIEIDIEVDGGINLENSNSLIEAGADILVAGTSIFKEKDRKEVILKMKNIK